MTTALKHSMGALFWASIILLVVEVMLALLLLGRSPSMFVSPKSARKASYTKLINCSSNGFGRLPKLFTRHLSLSPVSPLMS